MYQINADYRSLNTHHVFIYDIINLISVNVFIMIRNKL